MAVSPTAPRSIGGGSLASSTSFRTSHDSVSVETLVEHLLVAKRSLSSMTLLLRANDIAQLARQAHEDTVVLNAQSGFLRRGILEQLRILLRVRKSLSRSYDGAKREFGLIVQTMDAADDKLNRAMKMLRNTTVEPAFRPHGEEPRSLMDFVDEKSVDAIHDALKESIGELRATQQSFDGDLLRFETDIRALRKCLSRPQSSPSSSTSDQQPIFILVASLMSHSHCMAQLLSSLTHHFDFCVTAVRTTQGGAELARLKAAETAQSQHSGGTESVSISGVIAAQERGSDIDTLTAADRADMLRVVVADSAQVPGVVAELRERLEVMESELASILSQAEQARATHVSCMTAYRILQEVGSKLSNYVQSEIEFIDRWENEKMAISEKLHEMEELKSIYESYASAYDSLILEAERRRAIDDKISNIWRKAKESVDKLVEGDRKDRESFRLEVGDHLPTDLWPGMGGPVKRWNVVPLVVEEGKGDMNESNPGGGIATNDDDSLATLERSTVQAAMERVNRRKASRI